MTPGVSVTRRRLNLLINLATRIIRVIVGGSWKFWNHLIMKSLFLKTFLLFVSLSGLLVAQSISVFETEKSKWLARDGYMLDGGYNPASRVFAWLEAGTQAQHAGEIDAFVNELMADESWFGGNRGAGLTALQLYVWEGSRLTVGQKVMLWSRLQWLATDDYYYGVGVSNTAINCMTVRYVIAQQMPAATVRYDDAPNVFGSQPFTWEGRSYVRGQRYNALQLSRDWLLNWMEIYLWGGYLHGEYFSETYSYHFANCLLTLADPRMVSDPVMRDAAAATLSFMLFEFGVNTNTRHLAAPLGRTYMNQHTTGAYQFFYFEPYFGFMSPVHYGNTGSAFVSSYRLPAPITDFVRFDGQQEIFSSVQGGRYVWSTPIYTLGSQPNGGNWMLQIVSNDPGPYPQARRGQPFRIWLNNNLRDLDPSSCSGECYSEMGAGAYQYKDAMLIDMPDCVLHQALVATQWDQQETVAGSGWQFKVENGVAVAIRIESARSALECSRLGIDDVDFSAFKTAVLAHSQLGINSYTTRRGDFIENRSGRTFVNGQPFPSSLPRLEILRGFQRHTFESVMGAPTRDTIPPQKPKNVRLRP